VNDEQVVRKQAIKPEWTT